MVRIRQKKFNTELTSEGLFDESEFQVDVPKQQKAKTRSSSKPSKPRSTPLEDLRMQGCTGCDLQYNCIHPKMDPHGDGDLRVMIYGEAPGAEEDKQGIQFVGDSGVSLSDMLNELGLSLFRDFRVSNILQCRPPENKFPGVRYVARCSGRVKQQIEEFKPELIITVGKEATIAILDPPGSKKSKTPGIFTLRGRVFPSREHNCWVAPIIHPAYLLHKQGSTSQYKEAIIQDIANAIEYLGRDVNESINLINDKDGFERCATFKRALEVLEEAKQWPLVSLDYETNCLSPFDAGAKILCVGLAQDKHLGYNIPIDDGTWSNLNERNQIVEAIRGLLMDPKSTKIVHNLNFELLWSRRVLGCNIAGDIHDTIIGTHIVDETTGICSLAFQSFNLTGTRYKQMIDRGQIDESDPEVLAQYNCLDARYPVALREQQLEQMTGDLPKAFNFFMEGVKTLADIQMNGVKVDLDALANIKTDIEEYKNTLIERLEKNVYLLGEQPINFSSTQQVKVLLGKLGISLTGGSTKKEVLESIRTEDTKVKEVITDILKYRQVVKMQGTYVDGFKDLVKPDGYLYPTYSLYIPRTYRSSCMDPNLQNLPKRDAEFKSFRKVIIPRFDSLLEMDLSGAEVRVIAIVSRDPVLIKSINDPNSDFHKEWAAKIFKVPFAEVTKEQRNAAKGDFVFPEFYGSWYKEVAEDLNISERHAKKIEGEFWNMLKGVKKWQNKIIHECEKGCGYVETPLGFRRRMPMSKNKILNSPIQGTSFHLLLDGLIKINREIKARGLRSLPIVQVHDSVLFDVVDSEVEEIIKLGESIWGQKQFDWQCVPMACTWEIGPSWSEMEEIKI